MPRAKKVKNEIATLDFETDPFLYGRVPAPFVAGFYSDSVGFKHFYGNDCVFALLCFLDSLDKPHTIFAHNGGKFDFFLMIEYLENPIKIINGRIIKAKIGKHTLQDSYAILPIPLKVFDKDDIDYRKLESDVREFHKPEIIKYLQKDCTSLYSLVTKFIERFGDRLTIGGTAMATLKKIHPFDNQFKSHDDRFRPYYFGGRVEAFKTGILKGDWKVYDVNSMYPDVMRNCSHPTGARYLSAYSGIVDRVGKISGFAQYPFYFARIECEQMGAFPVRSKDAPLNFEVPFGEFLVTSHELKAAIKTGRVQNIKVLEVMAPMETISFADYVDQFSAEKIQAKKDGNKAGEIFAKLILNSSYGKFGQSPEHYYDYVIVQDGDEFPENEDYELYFAELGKPSIFRKNANSKSFFDVATAASITGAARANLMLGLHAATNPIYCDTDSIICESLDMPLHDFDLGKWKLEAQGDTCAVVGKKIYALRQGKKFVKTASKGAVLTGKDVFDVAGGKVFHWKNDAPSFSLSNGVRFVDRKIQSAEMRESGKSAVKSRLRK